MQLEIGFKELELPELKPEHFLYYKMYPVSLPYRPGYTLTRKAYDLIDDYRYNGPQGCTCWQGHPPCPDCMHPGNPANINEDETMWREITPLQIHNFRFQLWRQEFLQKFKRTLDIEDAETDGW